MSARMAFYGFHLKEMTDLFESKDEEALRLFVEKMHLAYGVPLFDIAATTPPQGMEAYDFDVFLAARSMIMGDIIPGNDLEREGQAVVRAVMIFDEFQDKSEKTADWKAWAPGEYYQEFVQEIDSDIAQLLSYLESGRPFFSKTFGDPVYDVWYGYLTNSELVRLSAYMHAHPRMTSDEGGFGAALLEAIDSVLEEKKDLYFSVF